jgi:ABC-type nitrate/sulfonate/bicarbonate transport system permease component
MNQADIATVEAGFAAAQVQARRRSHVQQFALNVIGVILFFAAWELLPRMVKGVNIMMFPPPSHVYGAAWELLSTGELLRHLLSSLERVAAGFAIGAAGGVVAGVLTARVTILRHLADPVLHGLRSVPVIGLVPLAIIWFGIGEASKVTLIAWGTFFPVWISAFIGARDVSEVYIRSAQALGSTPRSMLFTVVLPAALPLVLAGLRQSLALAFIVMVAAELVGARDGLGHLIATSQQLYRVDHVLVGLVTLGAVGFLADRAFALLLAKLFPWYGRT